MRSTFFGIEIGRTGISVSQKGLDVTGHNIANVDTAGFSRQRLITTAYDPSVFSMKFRSVELGAVGGGARVKILDQIRSVFLDRQFRTEQSLQSYWSTRTTALNYVESLFEGDDIATLSQNIRDMFSAFNTLTPEGNDSQQRIIVRSAAELLCDSFGQVYERLEEQQQSQNFAVETVIKGINSIADNIAQLNKSIYYYELDGEPANDLRDKRNLLLDELSSFVEISYYETDDNKMVVEIAGSELVNYMTVNQMGTETFTDPLTGNDYSNVCWLDEFGVPVVDSSGDTILMTSKQLGGELGSHIDLRDGDTSVTPGIPYFIEKINTMARAIAESVNSVHSAGWTHPANGTGSAKGVNFFNVPTISVEDPPGSGIMVDVPDTSLITAKNISLSADIIASEFNIAASTVEIILSTLVPGTLQQGNQENARALYEIFNFTDISLLDGTPIGGLNSFMDGVVLEVATTLSKSKSYLANHNIQLLSVTNQRTSVMGVSLDEEMTNLIKYQHAYSGSSRVITAMDEALETLINRTGRVGL